ncbi:hypothetical protein GOBAR_DD02636 [Gossypium barbadense]|nr:hypothetical protein GOBAR_DD02636 [Gossypium barbadense]
MAQLLLLCFFLINAFVAMAASENAPAPAPGEPYKAEAPTIRKLGKHQLLKTFDNAPASSPSQAPHTKKNMHPTVGSPSADHTAAITEPNKEENVSVEGEAIHLQNHHHHSMDKSVAGGGVILGGLATTFLVAVFCYIRATGRHKPETHQSHNENQ